MGFVKQIQIGDKEVVELLRYDWTWHYYLKREDSELYDRIKASLSRVPIQVLQDCLKGEM